MNYESEFKGKHITVLGLGVLGRGLGDAEFLAKCGAHILVTDKKSEAELAESVEKLKQYSNITFKLGGHDVNDFITCDLVVKAGGVPLHSKEIAAARDAGVPVVMSTALFAKYAMSAEVHLVGVTGTRGKTSVVHMIFSVLKKSGRRVHLGGNVRGVSTLALLPAVEPGDIAVLELDSWQLQGFGDLKISPDIAVFTNLMADHQNYYPDVETYFSDKANIFRYQKAGDTLFVGAGVSQKVQAEQPPVVPQVPPAIPADWKLKVVGEHNRENAALAAAALRTLGCSEEDIRTGLEAFEPVEGRLQMAGELHGTKVYNDNNATTPEATVAALKALGTRITLIVGGSEKDLPLNELVSAIQEHVSHVILLSHPKYTGSVRLAELLKNNHIAFEEVVSLEEAIESALSHTEKGTILFSPAFASFGMFKNEYDRNDRFLECLKRAGVR